MNKAQSSPRPMMERVFDCPVSKTACIATDCTLMHCERHALIVRTTAPKPLPFPPPPPGYLNNFKRDLLGDRTNEYPDGVRSGTRIQMLFGNAASSVENASYWVWGARDIRAYRVVAPPPRAEIPRPDGLGWVRRAGTSHRQPRRPYGTATWQVLFRDGGIRTGWGWDWGMRGAAGDIIYYRALNAIGEPIIRRR